MYIELQAADPNHFGGTAGITICSLNFSPKINKIKQIKDTMKTFDFGNMEAG